MLVIEDGYKAAIRCDLFGLCGFRAAYAEMFHGCLGCADQVE